ncbi:EpsG family protein [Flavobacterium sp. LT1R49]|uniref:EpsG family protein n=1 Tax=Flavobacterium arabinosi TaxID=3398737 RepID=UPI003A835E6A
MTDIKFTYIILETLLFIIFLISGYLLSKAKSNSQYWKIALIPIIAFAIISGLRFGREIDYNVYYMNYIFSRKNNEMEFLFMQLVNAFKYFSIPFYGFVLFCSTFLITSLLYFLNKFRKAVFFILPLFLGIMGIENLIRWYLAFSFILIAVKVLLDSRYFVSVLFVVLAILVHKGILLCVIVVFLFYVLSNKVIINHNVAVLLFAITMFLGSVDQLITVASVFNTVSISDSSKESNYMENAQSIASGDMSTGIYKTGPLTKIIIFISYVFPIYFGGKYLLKNKLQNKEYIWLYNLATFSIIIMPIFSLVDVFNRISGALMIFTITFVGMSTLYFYKLRHKNTVIYCLLLISFSCSSFLILRIPFYMIGDSRMLFIWDANGRNYLPF